MFYSWKKSTQRTNSKPDGFVLAAVLVAFAISLTLFGAWARAAVAQHRRARVQQVRLQAVRLAEAGVRRAIARQSLNKEFTAETWSVPAGVLDTSRAAEVRLRVARAEDKSKFRFAATAKFPIGTLQRAQITKHIDVPNPEPGETP